LVEVGNFQKGVTLNANYRWKGTLPPTIFGVRKLQRWATLLGRPYDPIFICLGISTYVTDRQTDRQTDGFAVANTALYCKQCSRAVKMLGLSFKAACIHTYEFHSKHFLTSRIESCRTPSTKCLPVINWHHNFSKLYTHITTMYTIVTFIRRQHIHISIKIYTIYKKTGL